MDPDGVEVLKGQVYSFEELGHANKGIPPHAFKADVSALGIQCWGQLGCWLSFIGSFLSLVTCYHVIPTTDAKEGIVPMAY